MHATRLSNKHSEAPASRCLDACVRTGTTAVLPIKSETPAAPKSAHLLDAFRAHVRHCFHQALDHHTAAERLRKSKSDTPASPESTHLLDYLRACVRHRAHEALAHNTAVEPLCEPPNLIHPRPQIQLLPEVHTPAGLSLGMCTALCPPDSGPPHYC